MGDSRVYTKKERGKMLQNENDNMAFSHKLNDFINGKLPMSKTVSLGVTPYVLRLAGATADFLIIKQNVLRNCLLDESRRANRHLEGHDISVEVIREFPEYIRNPILILEGQHPNTIVVVTELKNKENKNIIVPIALNLRDAEKEANKITSAYGKDDLVKYLNNHSNQIIAYNKEKAEMLFTTIGFQLPQTTSAICYDNSIAYTTANVKYPDEKILNNSEKEEFPDGESERNDNMAEQDSLLLKRIAALEKQVAAMSAEQQNLKEQINTVNQFISSIAESQNFEQSMATIESMGKQVLDCQKAEFWCYDGAENKYFSNDENRGGRDWQIAKENMRIAAESKKAYIADGEAYVPIVSNDKVAGILIASEKTGEFDKESLEKFAPNGQIANTIDLSLKKEFEHQGRITDELTRLKNRQGAKEYAANTMAHNANAQKDMCIIMCDIDHFKSINDTYGHDAGDTVLKNVAGIFQSGTRQGADAAFRWGGEEMVCVLNCDYNHAMDIAERLRQQIEKTPHLVYNADKQPVSVNVTISMGVHQITHDKEITQENAFSFFESQLKFADELAYKAKETGRNKVVGENDVMIEKNAEKENYSIFCIENGGEAAYFRDNNTSVDTFIQRLADCNGDYPEFLKGCTEISGEKFAELEQMGKPLPAFCSRINLDTVDITGEIKPKELSVWDNEKTATVNLDEAIQSVKENGSAELEFVPLASDDNGFDINEESDPDYAEIQEQALKELKEEYFEVSKQLDVFYNDFLYHNGIHNDESINLENKNGQLPNDLDTAENRELVKEYIDGQLKSGNISDNQRETLEELKNMISDVENAEKALDVTNDDLKFIAETREISQWSEDSKEKYSERNAERDEQGRTDSER